MFSNLTPEDIVDAPECLLFARRKSTVSGEFVRVVEIGRVKGRK
ncbi:hypothetical protein HanXRQr2_Chr15g0719091 [Helianthus annuus]|uniref:Uncharacterized protein n=1 Tax=Helianthus annuus TaxID=4232 RepID=A0A9K3E5Z1_HELAN|nr:hypothetical protein HanXRQr2_Chr15g0719091 [Helianthus annuus]KAJ0833398.1 hypothetical protein HanPSC8_Chr15g0689931 [Helianthus annuus]